MDVPRVVELSAYIYPDPEVGAVRPSKLVTGLMSNYGWPSFVVTQCGQRDPTGFLTALARLHREDP